MSEWINVNDRLPDNDERVLGVNGGAVFFASYKRSTNQWKNLSIDNGESQLVTHWLKIPDLPVNSVD